jgi:hypothetical protein
MGSGLAFCVKGITPCNRRDLTLTVRRFSQRYGLDVLLELRLLAGVAPPPWVEWNESAAGSPYICRIDKLPTKQQPRNRSWAKERAVGK